jgi:hypothetical protein
MSSMTQPTPQHKQIKAAGFQQESKQVHQSLACKAAQKCGRYGHNT